MRVGKKWLVPLVLFAVVLSGKEAIADEFRLVPGLGVKQEYNDNIFLDFTSPVSDFITTISPFLDITRNNERFQSKITTQFSSLLYATNSELNSIDQSHRGSASYRATPNLTLKGAAGYVIDSRPDRDVQTTGLVLDTAGRYHQDYSASAEYTISEKDAVILHGAYGKDHYGASNLIDLASVSLYATLAHDLSSWTDATTGRINLGYSRYRFYDQASTRVQDISGTVGITRSVNELWKLGVDVGARYTITEFEAQRLEPVFPPFFFQVVTQKETDRTLGGVGQAVLSYQGELTTVDLSVSHQLSPASGYTGATNRTSFTVSAARRLTYELRASLTAEYFLNKASESTTGQTGIDQETVRISPGFSYEFNRDVALEGHYGFTRINNRQAGTKADQHLVSLRLLLKHTLFE